MRKHILRILLCLCMVLTLFPTEVLNAGGLGGAAAAFAHYIIVGGVTLNAGTPYLANGASTASADQPTSGGYVHFDAGTDTLTLHDASINGAANGTNNYGIYALDNLTIVLEGSNSITAYDATCDDFYTDWRGDSKGIYVYDSALTISGTGSLTISSGKGCSSYGIYANGVTIKDGAEVKAFAGCADASAPDGAFYSCGIYSSEPCSISGDANVTAVGGAIEGTASGGSVRSIGISVACWNIGINGARVTATGNTQAINSAPAVTDCTITAATDVLGNDVVAYVGTNMSTYKYIRIAPGGYQAQWGIAGENGSEPDDWVGQGTFSQADTYMNSLGSGAAYIKLLSDVNNAWLPVQDGKTVVLDLNGKTLDGGLSGQDARDGGFVIAINGGTLTLKDSGTGGKITGGNNTNGAGGVCVRWGGTFYMEGGIITGNHAAYGSGVFVAQNSIDGRDSHFYMSGGSITGNDSTYDGAGVCISSYAAMTVSGEATIQDNFKGGTLSNGVYVQGSGEKCNVALEGKAITVSGPLTGNIGIVKQDSYLNDRHSIQIAVSDSTYQITQSDANHFTSDSSDCFTEYSNVGVNPVVLLRSGYTMTYDANGATFGSVPTDTNFYGFGDTVTVAVNSGNLQKAGHTFAGWNTKVDGTGTSYAEGSGEFNIFYDTILYAEWTEVHHAGTDWMSDTDNHWNICSDCGEKQNIAAHEFKWVIDKDATATESGSKHEECKICGYKKAAVDIPATGLPTAPEDDTESEDDTPPADIPAPLTGDSNSVGIYIAMMLFAFAGMASAIILGRKNSCIVK